MAKRKYLKPYKFTFLLLINLHASNIFASAWLPKVGKYRYSISTSILDKRSHNFKRNKRELYLEIEQGLDSLHNDLENANQLSADPRNQAVAERDIAIIKKDIAKLQAELADLTFYQDHQLITSYIEYGATENCSLGIKGLHKQNKFVETKYTNAKATSYDKEAEIFAKFKLFQNQKYIVSVQPQIAIRNHSYNRSKTFQEIALLMGTSQERTPKHRFDKVKETFCEVALSFGSCLSRNCSGENFYTASISEGIKLPYGFMASNYTKYTFRKNAEEVYKKTIYNQMSIAKEFNLSTSKLPFKAARERKNNNYKLTVQLGYFWDQSLTKKAYQISGSVFSVWIDT